MPRARRTVSLLAGGAVLCGLLLLAGAAQAADGGRPQKSTTGAVLRSLAVPGWGQLYNRSYVKAAAFAALEGTLIINASREHDLMMRYKTGGAFLDEKYFRNRRNRLLWWLAGSALLAMGDAYVDAQLYGLDVSPHLEINSETAVGLTVSCNF